MRSVFLRTAEMQFVLYGNHSSDNHFDICLDRHAAAALMGFLSLIPASSAIAASAYRFTAVLPTDLEY